MTIKGRKGDTIVSADEQISKVGSIITTQQWPVAHLLLQVNFDKLSTLRPVFDAKNGTVTAANASPISDGAAALVLVSGRKAKELSLPVVARIRSFADAAQRPEHFTTAPSLAIPKALARAKLAIQDVDFFEINEAFAAVALANTKLLNLDPAKVNVLGGSYNINASHIFSYNGCSQEPWRSDILWDVRELVL